MPTSPAECWRSPVPELLARIFLQLPQAALEMNSPSQEEDHLVGYFLDKTHDVGSNQNVLTRSFLLPEQLFQP